VEKKREAATLLPKANTVTKDLTSHRNMLIRIYDGGNRLFILQEKKFLLPRSNWACGWRTFGEQTLGWEQIIESMGRDLTSHI